MLEGGFVATALAFIGIMPTLPERASPVPEPEAVRPTTPVSPQPHAAPVSDTHSRPMAGIQNIHAKSDVMDISGLARIADIHAIPYFIDEWIDLIGETNVSLDDLVRSYADLRGRHPMFPAISKKRLSQLLAANGCIRMYRDTKGDDGARHRFVVFEMRERRAAKQRRAA